MSDERVRRTIVPHPRGGLYIGQTELSPGDTAKFEAAIGQRTALWTRDAVITEALAPEPNAFDLAAAERGWAEGKIALVRAWEATDLAPAGSSVDQLLRGELDGPLGLMADDFRRFGKPMIFHTAREPNAAGSAYQGGFGPDGKQSLLWALANERGLAEFDPSGFPNAELLYADLGDPNVCDGLERLIAAHRYYYDFFVNRHGLDFITFDSMGWAALDYVKWSLVVDGVDIVKDATPTQLRIIRSCYDFKQLYPGNAYVDWVSLTFYMLDYYADDHPDRDLDLLLPHSFYLDMLDATLADVRQVARGKPVFIIEAGFPDRLQKRAAQKLTVAFEHILSSYPEVQAFAMWAALEEDGDWPWDPLVRPETPQADAFRKLISDHPSSFHSCVQLADGTTPPRCSPQ